MNFVFIIDTSLSMNQTYDNISFFDIAKSSIRKFVLDREISNFKLNRNKSDKYFLVTLNQNIEENFLYQWSTTTEHFLCQLNALKNTCDFTNIDFAIKKAFQMINYIKKIGIEKHVYGRLFSKIHNSYIILITDGGHLSSNDKILTINNCNYSTLSLKDQNEFILEGFHNIYKELYRWDQSFYAIVLTDKTDKNNSFESFKIFDKICKNIGGKIITVDNPNSLNDKLNDLSNKYFQNNRVNINFNINKQKKTYIITYLEYNGNIDKINEKWPFPDELIINKEAQELPTKNALPFYELGNYKYDFSLSQDYYDEYDIKDRKFIMTLLTEGDCWNNLTLSEFISKYRTSVTTDILVSDLNSKKILKKPFAIININFSKELLDSMNETITKKGNINFTKFFSDFQTYYNNSNNNISKNNLRNINPCNFIKCKFLNLPYHYTEFFSLMNHYKLKSMTDTEMQINFEKYLSSIPFYYFSYVINIFEKNKIKKFLDKYKEEITKKILNENFNNKIHYEMDALFKYENKQVMRINKQFSENKKLHMEKKANCCFKEVIYKNQNDFYMANNNHDEVEADNEYLDFIDRIFKIDKICNVNNNKVNNNIYNTEQNYGYRNGFTFIRNKHESDIEIMGDYRDYFFKNEHLRSYLIPEIEIRYLIKDFFFGNQFIERRNAYSSKNVTNPINTESIQDESIFHYLNDEDNNISINPSNNKNYNLSQNRNNNNISLEASAEQIDNQTKLLISDLNKDKGIYNNSLINNKRSRENSMDSINLINSNSNDSIQTNYTSKIESNPSSEIFSDNLSEADGSDNLMLDELSDSKYTSKMGLSLIEEFKNSVISDKIEIKDGIKINVKYEVSKEKLNKWKFQKKIRTISQELINSIHNDENNIIKVINKIIEQNTFDKKLIHNFVEKIYYLCQSYGVNSMVQAQIQKLKNSYE